MYIDHDELRALKKENRELKERVKELEAKHLNECGQIALYDDDCRNLKKGFFNLLEENQALRFWISWTYKVKADTVDEAVDKIIEELRKKNPL